MKTAREWVQPEKYHVYTAAEVCDLVAAVQIATLKDAAFIAEGVLPEPGQQERSRMTGSGENRRHIPRDGEVADPLPMVSVVLTAVKNGILALASSIEAPDA